MIFFVYIQELLLDIASKNTFFLHTSIYFIKPVLYLLILNEETLISGVTYNDNAEFSLDNSAYLTFVCRSPCGTNLLFSAASFSAAC